MSIQPETVDRVFSKRLIDTNRRAISFLVYALLTGAAYALAFAVRFDLAWPPSYTETFLRTLPLLIGIRLLASHLFRLSTGRWRFVGTGDVLRLGASIAAGSVLFVICLAIAGLEPRVPRWILVLEPALTALFIATTWLVYRTGYEQVSRPARRERRRVLIAGAGETAELLIRQINRYSVDLLAVGCVDDDPLRWGTTVHGVEVLGATDDIEKIARKWRAEEIIIAMPSAEPARLRRIVQMCSHADISFRVLPPIADVLAGNITLSQLREVQIEDLLGRDPVKLEVSELAEDLAGQCVLITGAAGSIGSELARQVALHRPAKLILLDRAETEVYYLQLDLEANAPDVPLVPIVGDICDAGTLNRVFERYRPDRVFHAAAYKHVPLMECNVRQAVRNNLLGTWRVAEMAGRHGAGKFVLISTDKAVRPSSVMGATKRMAEIIVLHLQKACPKTAYSAVRFGNVLGSNGSVLPIFKRQLSAGGPLTVTHPDVTRYFMTIPEAVQLVLKSSLVPEVRGSIAMLDMGEPVLIADLARNLLRLSGAGTGNGGIRYTGLRKGEKLHEELVAPDETTRATREPKVCVVATPAQHFDNLPALIQEWESLLDDGSDDEIRGRLVALFPGLSSGHEPEVPEARDVPVAPRYIVNGSSAVTVAQRRAQ
ncbi:MAG TPA: nucleoside-diphosphate sugar epimerase/dehydratase [Longimicrobiales bacterium]